MMVDKMVVMMAIWRIETWAAFKVDISVVQIADMIIDLTVATIWVAKVADVTVDDTAALMPAHVGVIKCKGQ